MTDNGKYCCFNCPEDNYDEKNLKEKCPNCNEPYGFPLFSSPQWIGEYRVLKPLGRGFYGATYVVEHSGIIPRKHVLKVVPKSFYNFFDNNFEEECKIHAEAANGADFLVDIQGAFDEIVSFGSHEIECHIAVLDFIEGHLLQDYLSSKKSLTPSSIAQLATDLFRILDELVSRKLNHNDFHAGNIIIEELSREHSRRDAIDPSIRAIAIDLGSLSKDRRSGGDYKGDLHWISNHIEKLIDLHIRDKESFTDLESRLEWALRMISKSIKPSIEKQRTPSSEDIIRIIEDEYFRSAETWRPWLQPLTLRKFSDSYNARTLDAWHVPQLLVDPGEKWQRRISSPGPLIVTGMRGCGKTMLLRALQFHARSVQRTGESNDDIIQRIKADGYVGLFVSGAKLLPLSDEETLDKKNMLARLAVAYALEAAGALAHLKDITTKSVNGRAAIIIQNTLESIVDGFKKSEDILSLHELQRHLIQQLNNACRVNSALKISSHPSNAFPLLAKSVKECSEIWRNSQVLFLLDEVSTRTLTMEQIDEILSSLMFQNTQCSFKLTSETQTIFLNLKSPGGLEPAAHWRDFTTFDLGSEVHKRLKRKGGKKFIEEILTQRSRFFSGHPAALPDRVLGDISLSKIAKNITSSSPNSPVRKKVYHGLSALKAVCVGDIGSTITIYENILNQANGSFPVKQQYQNDVFQEFCSTHLYLLDRRDSHLKGIAKSFAEASYELLMQSAEKKEDRGLRQYSSIYVRVTAGDKDEQGKRLRELVDAGVFVFQGGSPRTKTKDSDPVLQFKLTFRKIYGLADSIGLAERDRFELSGADLEEWLNTPDKGREILLRNLSTRSETETDEDEDEIDADEGISFADHQEEEIESQQIDVQLSLFNRKIVEQKFDKGILDGEKLVKLPFFEKIKKSDSSVKKIDVLYIALGFEERTSQSVVRSIEHFSPARVIALKYPEQGRSNEIINFLEEKKVSYSIIEYEEIFRSDNWLKETNLAFDITGFTKAAIFVLISSALKNKNEVYITYTEAKEYYPLENSLSKILEAQSEKNYHLLLKELKNVLSGETGPYTLKSLESIESDVSRLRSLFAFGSPKHERIIQLVEERRYDQIEILVDSRKAARNTVSRLAAEVAVSEATTGSIKECNICDPNEIIKAIELGFRRSYLYGGLNFEIGLTGDKLEAVAAAAFSSVASINNVWYVKPKKFDPERFSKGFGKTYFYSIKK